MDASIRGLEDSIKMRKVGLITVVTVSTDNIRTNKATNNLEIKIGRKLSGYFKQKTGEITNENTWTGLQN